MFTARKFCFAETLFSQCPYGLHDIYWSCFYFSMLLFLLLLCLWGYFLVCWFVSIYVLFLFRFLFPFFGYVFLFLFLFYFFVLFIFCFWSGLDSNSTTWSGKRFCYIFHRHIEWKNYCDHFHHFGVFIFQIKFFFFTHTDKKRTASKSPSLRRPWAKNLSLTVPVVFTGNFETCRYRP